MVVQWDCFWYVVFYRDGFPDKLVEDGISVHIRYPFAIVSLTMASCICIIISCIGILASPMWCKPSLDDIWIGLYLEIYGLIVYLAWCVPQMMFGFSG